jgi:hypothetical protein
MIHQDKINLVLDFNDNRALSKIKATTKAMETLNRATEKNHKLQSKINRGSSGKSSSVGGGFSAKSGSASIGGLNIASAGVGLSAVTATGAIVKSSLSAYAEQEDYLVGLTALLKGNKYEADRLNESLVKMALSTKFELADLQKSSRLLISYGSTSKNVAEEIKMLGDVAAGAMKPIDEIAYLYGTIRTQGKADLVDRKQFSKRGIAITEELAKVTGYTAAQIVEGGKDIKISFKQVEEAFKMVTSEGGRYYNMMNSQQNLLSTTFSNATDAINQAAVATGDALKNSAKGIAVYFTEVLNDYTQLLKMSNRLEDVMSKTKQYTFSDGSKTDFGFSWMQQHVMQRDDYLRFKTQNEELEGKINEASGNKLKTQKLLSETTAAMFKLSKERIKLSNQPYDSFNKLQELERTYAILSDKRTKLRQSIDLQNKREDESFTSKKDSYESSAGGGGGSDKFKNFVGNRAKVINVTINDGLVSIKQLVNQDTSMSIQEISKLLADALNKELNGLMATQ